MSAVEEVLGIMFVISCILVGIFLTTRILLPREVWTHVLAEIITAGLRALWRLIVVLCKGYIARREAIFRLFERIKRRKQ